MGLGLEHLNFWVCSSYLTLTLTLGLTPNPNPNITPNSTPTPTQVCSSITDAGVRELALACSGLASVDLRLCSKVCPAS